MKEIGLRSSVDARVRIPGSKSMTHRVLIAAALAVGESRLEDALACGDTVVTQNGLSMLGVKITGEDNCFRVTGTGGAFPPADGTGELDLGDSGTSYRLLLPVAAISRRQCLLTGSPRMQQRPVGPLVQALNELGGGALCMGKKGYPPVLVKGSGIAGGGVTIQGDTSSQFVSALLLCGPYANKDVEIEVMGNLVSRPYVDVTTDVMDRFGVSVEREGYHRFKVRAGRPYQASRVPVEGDCSSASYFWAAAAVTGGRVVTENIHPFSTRQGDLAFLQVMTAMGCRVAKGKASVRVEGGRLRGIEVDMQDMPDMVPGLAAMALFADGRTLIRNVAHLRHKESDRLRAVAQEFRKLGGAVEVLPDGLIIQGGRTLRGAVVDPHNDHRIAMSLAVVGLRVPGVRILDEGCVEKSFPGFWDLWESL
ncbi:MAG: 3-phosphoshikimate 1-carboxyvinyltransferase [Thermodesulfobacteriota bacterium]